MKILHVVSHLHKEMGGSILGAVQIANCVHGDSHECTVAGTVSKDSNSVEFFKRNFPELRFIAFNHHFPRHSFTSLGLRQWLYHNIGNYDLIHIHGLFKFPYLDAGLLARSQKKPLIVSPHNSLDPFDLQKKYILKKYFYGPYYVREIMSHAKAVLCTSQTEADRMELFGTYPEPAKKVVALPVDPSGKTAERHCKSFRKEFSIEDSDMVMLFMSRLDPKKGLDLLIKALSELKSELPGFVLAIAGSGERDYEGEIKSLAKKCGVDDRIRWCGFVSGQQKQSALNESDFFVLPSYNETFGIVLVEAMYSGLPILTSNGVYIWKTLSETGAALICDPEQNSVMENIRLFAMDADLRSKLAKEGPRKALNLFSSQALQKQYRQLYLDITNKI